MSVGLGAPALPVAAVAVSAVVWGLWWLPLRALGDRSLHGDWASLAVFTAATAVLVPFAWAKRRRMRSGGQTLFWTGLLVGVALVLWNHAVLVGEVVRVVLLFYLAPVWATLFAWLLLGERVTPPRLLAIVLGLSGAAVVLGFEAGFPVPASRGDWLGLSSGLVFALSVTIARKAPEVPGFDRTFASFVFATLTALALSFLADSAPTGAQMLAAIPLAAVIGLFFIVPATWMLLWGAGHLDPGRISILLMLEVVAAAISSTLMTDEPFGWREAVGCVLILSAGFAEAVPDLRRAARVRGERDRVIE